MMMFPRHVNIQIFKKIIRVFIDAISDAVRLRVLRPRRYNL